MEDGGGVGAERCGPGLRACGLYGGKGQRTVVSRSIVAEQMGRKSGNCHGASQGELGTVPGRRALLVYRKLSYR